MKKYNLSDLIERNKEIKRQGGFTNKGRKPKLPERRNDRAYKIRQKLKKLFYK